MTPARNRQVRLARILAIRKAALRAAEAGFAAASASAATARTRAGAVQMLIETSATASGETALAALRGAASLRASLAPAQLAATDRANSEGQLRAAAASRMADAGARHERTWRDFTEARTAADLESEDRESAERTPIRRRR